MKLYIQIFKLLFKKFVFRTNNGVLIKNFSEEMGVVYIKLAQILATQNYDNLFTEKDRQMLSSICDTCNPISYEEIEEILKKEYGKNLDHIFSFIEKKPVGSASVSQVHRAILTSGEEVAIKIKRKDITRTIEEDIKKIRKIIHRFGRVVNFGNYTGGDHALDLYLEWIFQETDFHHEKENIKIYQQFADSVNGKVPDTKQIKIPKLYEKYCTDNVIVMEFVRTQTINKMALTDENKEKIITALNSYIQSSFWAMYHNKQVVFHGDPHSGNICVDDDGNICFLDMGLLFVLSDTDTQLCRKFFLAAYSGNYEKLYNMLVSYGNMSEEKKQLFKEDCRKYCEEVKGKEITYYFMDMINVCLNYEFIPPNFLFNMAKTFVCLNGINNFSENRLSAKELLQKQTMEFLIQRSLGDCKSLIKDSVHSVSSAIQDMLQNGVAKAFASLVTDRKLQDGMVVSLENMEEMFALLKIFYHDVPPSTYQKTKYYKNTMR